MSASFFSSGAYPNLGKKRTFCRIANVGVLKASQQELLASSNCPRWYAPLRGGKIRKLCHHLLSGVYKNKRLSPRCKHLLMFTIRKLLGHYFFNIKSYSIKGDVKFPIKASSDSLRGGPFLYFSLFGFFCNVSHSFIIFVLKFRGLRCKKTLKLIKFLAFNIGHCGLKKNLLGFCLFNIIAGCICNMSVAFTRYFKMRVRDYKTGIIPSYFFRGERRLFLFRYKPYMFCPKHIVNKQGVFFGVQCTDMKFNKQYSVGVVLYFWPY